MHYERVNKSYWVMFQYYSISPAWFPPPLSWAESMLWQYNTVSYAINYLFVKLINMK